MLDCDDDEVIDHPSHHTEEGRKRIKGKSFR
jgi:hypothetical protein